MNQQELDHLRHSCAHLLAAAVMQLYPDAKRTIGPAIENGFYYDFEFSSPISEKDFPKIEKRMREIVKHWKGFEKYELTAEEAKSEYPGNPYKHELIDEFTASGERVSFYQSGEFRDLCKGGHVEKPNDALKHFKLLSVAGAYWRGDSNNTMLTRIYGTCFLTKEELDQYLFQIEEAEKRDHRKLGKELDLFTFSPLVGSGLPLFTPNGTMLRELLNDFSQGLRIQQGFQKVWVPHITKNDLYKMSGHWDKFGDELFLVKSQETSDEMVMKPMNCPHHQQIYVAKPRSYRDLPLKYLETTTIYRDEKAGELLGLSRVRSVTQDDSHTFCTPEQIESIYQSLIDIVKKFYGTLGMTFRARLSFRDPSAPEKYLGEPELWEKAQSILLNVAQINNLDYFVAEGEAAFYGPKIDFMVKDAIGREWQLATPQLDFVQPKRFGLTYVDAAGTEQTPVMIHFALMGSLERFLSVYIEHTAGAFPLWVSPLQMAIISVGESHRAHSEALAAEFRTAGIRVDVDNADETVGNKIRKAVRMKVPYMLVIGDKEINSQQLMVRKRGEKEAAPIEKETFLKHLAQLIAERSLEL
ncbi:MAG: threonine--tRNA ligase [Candidatus Kerfeldbacteria bacterium]|nr:threonine--tRNA ligase [Candidatus Kerfeldbacteria bacterium]